MLIEHGTLAQFAKRARMPRPRRPDIDLLTRITRKVMSKIPYTNIHMLDHASRRPDAGEIARRMLALEGGPCSVFNPFMNCYLRDYAGFDSTLVAAAESGGEMNHTALHIRLAGEDWLVDYGNGYPYLSPVPLRSQTEFHHAGFFYRVTPARGCGAYQMLHRRARQKARVDYIFSLTPREHGYFDAMFDKHYSDPKFCGMLRRLRFARFPRGEMRAIRNNVLVLTGSGKLHVKRLRSDAEIIAAVQRHFPQAHYPVQQGLDYLRRNS
ncbi:MAG: arylamine N-acetyltransferase [Gammaproteobacteria bacterium]